MARRRPRRPKAPLIQLRSVILVIQLVPQRVLPFSPLFVFEPLRLGLVTGQFVDFLKGVIQAYLFEKVNYLLLDLVHLKDLIAFILQIPNFRLHGRSTPPSERVHAEMGRIPFLNRGQSFRRRKLTAKW